MKIQNIITAVLLFFALNCNYHYTATFVLPKNPLNTSSINEKILIRNVSLKDSGFLDHSEILILPLKSNIKIFLENSNIFEHVAYFNKYELNSNSKIIDFEFEIYKNKINPKFNLNPIAIISFGYLGGSIKTYVSELKLNILVYNSKNILENKGNFIFSESIEIDPNNNIAFERMPELKSMFILNSLLHTMKGL